MEAVVIATYNESLNAPRIVREVKGVLPGATVIVVDDNSPDGTAKLVKDLALPGVHVLIRRRSRGYGTAVRDGLIHALKLGAEHVATMDADFSHNPAELAHMFETLADHDIAVGSRYVGGVRVMNWSPKRLLLSLFANFYVRTILGMPTTDCTSGYRAYRAAILERMNLQSLRSNGYSFLVEMLYRGKVRGARIAEVPIVFEERREGESKMSGGVIAESVLMPWRLRFGRQK